MAIIYLDRIVAKGIPLCDWTIHRLFCTCILLASKFHQDVVISNSFIAKIGGLSTLELNRLEIEFLRIINYDLIITPQDYDLYRLQLEAPNTTNDVIFQFSLD